MVEFRPHILNWVTAGGPTTADPVTGYPVEGEPGEEMSISCRFHLGGIKEFKNEDNTLVKQVGRIRVDRGSDMPVLGQIIDVPGQFNGPVRDIYRGQLSWRIDV